MSLVGFQASKTWMFLKKIYCVASFAIILRQKEFPLFLDFLRVFHMVWKNQEGGEP